jgi:hypothetical protein
MTRSLFQCWWVATTYLGLCRVDGFVCHNNGKGPGSVSSRRVDTRFGWGRLPAAVHDNGNREIQDAPWSYMVNFQHLRQVSLRVGNIHSLLAALYIAFGCQLHSATAVTPRGPAGKPHNFDA